MSKTTPDKILLASIAGIIIIGFIALMSASFVESQRDFDNIYGYFIRQLVFGFAGGLILGTVFYKVPYKRLKTFALPFLLFAIFLMLLVFIPGISASNGTAQRWIDLKIATFQPAELLKLAFIVYLAAWLDAHKREITTAATFVPFLVFLAFITVLLALQPNISTLGVLIAVSGVMYFIAGIPIKYAAAAAISAAGLLLVLIKIAPYRLNRITTFLDHSSDPLGIGYQLNQALIAVGSGALGGLGITQGIQKKSFLPEPMSDSIFAVWAEETGFIGSMILVGLFTLLMWGGLRLAARCDNFFARLIVVGITAWIFIQTFVNIGAMLGLMPLTGITLPLVSYGSSSMLVTFGALGLLLQISKTAKR